MSEDPVLQSGANLAMNGKEGAGSGNTRSVKSSRSSTRSISSTAAAARIKAIKARYARHLADLEHRAIEAERNATQAALDAEIALMEAEDEEFITVDCTGDQTPSQTVDERVVSWVKETSLSNLQVLTEEAAERRNNETVVTTAFQFKKPQALQNTTPADTVFQRSTQITEEPVCGPSGMRSAEKRDCMDKVERATRELSPGNGNGSQTVSGFDFSRLVQGVIDLANKPSRGKPTKLTPFSGSISEWLLFKRNYECSKSYYTPVENMNRLLNALKGEAREAVCSLMLLSENPDDVINALEIRFARPDMIVRNEINTVRALPKIKEPSDIQAFACKVRNCVAVTKLLNKTPYIHSPELLQAILANLTPLLQNKWQDFAALHHIQEKSILETLADFLDGEAKKQAQYGAAIWHPLANAGRAKSLPTPSSGAQYGRNATYLKSNNISVHSSSCILCSEDHSVKHCEKFLAMPASERRVCIRKVRACPRCLKKSSHDWRHCPAKSCSVENCSGNHHTLLHSAENASSSSKPSKHRNVNTTTVNDEMSDNSTDTEENNCETKDNLQLEKSSEPQNTNMRSKEVESPKSVPTSLPTSFSYSCSGIKSGRVLLKILPVVLSGPKGEVHTFGLLDDGSTATLIDPKLADEIGATGPVQNVSVNGVTGSQKNIEVKRVNFKIRGKYCSDYYEINNAHTFPLRLKSQTISLDELSKLPYLTDITDHLTYCDAKPRVLIGSVDWPLLICKENRIGTQNQPAASRTALGWVLFGSTSKMTTPVKFVNHCAVTDPNEELNELIRENYRLDSIGIKPREPYNTQEKRAIQILESTTRRLPNGRFETGLLWRNDNRSLPDSYNHALSRLNSLSKKFSKDKNYENSYKTNIEAYVEKDYAEPCQNLYDARKKPSCWYLLHFGVINPNKPGKIRVVHDAAAKTLGISLNSMLLQGPDFLQSLLGILFRFREGPVAMTADIREMFSQVKIRTEDFQRYLWQENGELKEFRMSSLMFGAACSPCSAIYVKDKNATEFQSEFPDAVKAILKDHYMDDFLGSVNDIDQASRLASEIFNIHAKAGFEMRDWVSNKVEALKLLSPQIVKVNPQGVDLGLDKQDHRVLGLWWNPGDDTLSFKINITKLLPRQFTKRQVLRDLMRIYDPLGILTPITTYGKILFQRTWRLVKDWDEKIPPVESDQWGEWYHMLISISLVKVPRWYGFIPDPDINQRELHIFVDASSDAYACVAFWRFKGPDGAFKLSLIASKSRVAPLKPVSIPRLELQGALLGARLAQTITKEHGLKNIVNRTFWCDSRTVLAWIKSDAHIFRPFVANRVGEINEITKAHEWRWLTSSLNVADDATRAKSINLRRWLEGPEFLLLPELDWPVEPSEPVRECREELKCHSLQVFSCSFNLTPNCAKFSKWYRLLRATARAHQYIRILKERCSQNKRISRQTLLTARHSKKLSHRDFQSLSARDIKTAELHLLRESQAHSFPQELASIRRNEPPPKDSKLKGLPVSLSEDGLLRLDSRIEAAPDVSLEVRKPVVLDGRHHVVRLLVAAFHVWAHHGLNEAVVNEIRQRYWVLRLRPTVRTVAKQCQTCRLRKATTSDPPIGDLPRERLYHHKRPFTFTGIDYFGPINVTVGRHQEKRYVALFTCLVVRAVHLELVPSLTADSAIMALRRFMARRGNPEKVFTDNGTAFVGADRELKKARLEINDEVKNYLATKAIDWIFIPPSSPFMGGAWERLVKTVKQALAMTLKNRNPREEILSTLLFEVESVVNSRPLTHVSVSHEDREAITPNSFLIGTSSGLPVIASVDDTDLFRRPDWRKTSRLADIFWERWVKEYLPTLAPRRCSNACDKSLAVGDLVLVVDGNLPRGYWPRGRIKKIYPGKDGVVRVADVLKTAGVLKRPARKLVNLPVDPPASSPVM